MKMADEHLPCFEVSPHKPGMEAVIAGIDNNRPRYQACGDDLPPPTMACRDRRVMMTMSSDGGWYGCSHGAAANIDESPVSITTPCDEMKEDGGISMTMRHNGE